MNKLQTKTRYLRANEITTSDFTLLPPQFRPESHNTHVEKKKKINRQKHRKSIHPSKNLLDYQSKH